MGSRKKKLSSKINSITPHPLTIASRNLQRDAQRYSRLEIRLELQNPKFSSLSVDSVITYGDSIDWKTKESKKITLSELLDGAIRERNKYERIGEDFGGRVLQKILIKCVILGGVFLETLLSD